MHTFTCLCAMCFRGRGHPHDRFGNAETTAANGHFLHALRHRRLTGASPVCVCVGGGDVTGSSVCCGEGGGRMSMCGWVNWCLCVGEGVCRCVCVYVREGGSEWVCRCVYVCVCVCVCV